LILSGGTIVPADGSCFKFPRQPRSDHVQVPCSWSADFFIGNDCAFDGTGSGSNDDFGGGPSFNETTFN